MENAADAAEYMKNQLRRKEKADVVFLDPPRAGCSREFLQSLIRLAPERIVYISCNPETLARDVGMLVHNHYVVQRVTPIDMFPFTTHIETVCLLTKVKK